MSYCLGWYPTIEDRLRNFHVVKGFAVNFSEERYVKHKDWWCQVSDNFLSGILVPLIRVMFVSSHRVHRIRVCWQSLSGKLMKKKAISMRILRVSVIRFEHYRQEKKTGENALMTFINLMFHLKNCVLPGKETCQTRLIILTPTRGNRVWIDAFYFSFF